MAYNRLITLTKCCRSLATAGNGTLTTREYLIRLLKITDGHVTEAARLAGRNRTELYRLLGKHELSAAMFNHPSPESSAYGPHSLHL